MIFPITAKKTPTITNELASLFLLSGSKILMKDEINCMAFYEAGYMVGHILAI